MQLMESLKKYKIIDYREKLKLTITEGESFAIMEWKVCNDAMVEC